MELAQARKFALSLPKAAETPHFEMSSFRVRGKIFATIPTDGAHPHIFVEEEQREPLIASEPDSYQKLWWGSKVAGVRVALANASPATAKELLGSP